MRRVASAAVLSLLLTSTIILAFYVHRVGAIGTIYIRADGSIDPPTANITTTDSVTYTFTDSNYDPIVIEKGDIVVDGAGYTLQGSGSGDGFHWSTVNNVSIRNTQITRFDTGIRIYSSSGNTISGNNITGNNYYGIALYNSSNNNLQGNSIWANNYYGIRVDGSSNSNVIQWNNITGYHLVGIGLYELPSFNTLRRNTIEKNVFGISLSGSANNIIQENNIEENLNGTYLYASSDNAIYHNSFMDNTQQVCAIDSSNDWDSGYPSGGNYWSNYMGTDTHSGLYQNVTGSDGIGDEPYTIDVDNHDRYPLMEPFLWGPHDVGITSLTASKTVVGQGFPVQIDAIVFNDGESIETATLGFLSGDITIFDLNVILLSRTSMAIAFTWNTSGFAKGNYTIWAHVAPVPGETETADNTYIGGWVMVTISGDVNGDRDVDIFDIVRMAGGYGTQPPNPKYDPSCDIDGDGDIDIFDIVIAAGHYGDSW